MGCRIFDFTPVVQPGEARVLTYVLRSRRRGFENDAGDLSVVSNGTFFNNQIVRIGYQCDMTRLGLWGSSFSGGLVVWAAERDPRVKALYSQLGSLDGRWVVANDRQRQITYEEATKRARGEIGYPPPGAKAGSLIGAPIRSRFIDYAPVEDLQRTPKCAMLFVIAEKEELMNNRDNGIKAYPRVLGPKNLVTIPNITHDGIYREARAQAFQLAVEWFDKYLKP